MAIIVKPTTDVIPVFVHIDKYNLASSLVLTLRSIIYQKEGSTYNKHTRNEPVLKLIFSPNKKKDAIAEKIGFVAIMTRTLATAVCCRADIKAKLERPHQMPTVQIR